MSTQTKDPAYYVHLKTWQNQVLDQFVQEQKRRLEISQLLSDRLVKAQKDAERKVSLQKMRKAVITAPEFVPGIIRMKAAVNARPFVPQFNQY